MSKPPMLTLYLLRHGETERTRENVYCGAGMDPGLTEEGHRMARAFAEAHPRDRVRWAAVYCSPMLRTRQMAAPICETLGVEPAVRAGLKEIAYGAWEGLTLEEIQERFPDDYRCWTADPAWYPPTGGGEPAVVIARRALGVVEEIIQGAPAQDRADGGSAEDERNVLIVSHKATIRILLCALLGIDLGQFRYRLACPVGSVSVVEFTRNGPMLMAMGETGYLRKG